LTIKKVCQKCRIVSVAFYHSQNACV